MSDGRHHGVGTSTFAAEAQSFDLLLRALDHAGVAVFVEDGTGRYRWTCHTPLAWSADPVIGKVDTDFLPPDVASALAAAKAEIREGGPGRRLDVELRSVDGSSSYDVWLDPCDDDTGGRGILTTAVETTQHRQREQTLRTLLREVSHRSKNLLAIIQSIASQTGRYADSIDEFLTRFRGRLQSLSSSQDLVTSSNWRGADLVQLVTDQVARYCADPARNLRLVGSNPYLTPNAALHVGLALHELAVNSVSYGALSFPDGKVQVSVTPASDGELELEWREALRSDLASLQRRRFGTVALERIVPSSLDSRSTLTTEEGLLVYRLILPTDSFHLSGS